MKLEYNFVVDKTLSKTKNNPNRNNYQIKFRSQLIVLWFTPCFVITIQVFVDIAPKLEAVKIVIYSSLITKKEGNLILLTWLS